MICENLKQTYLSNLDAELDPGRTRSAAGSQFLGRESQGVLQRSDLTQRKAEKGGSTKAQKYIAKAGSRLSLAHSQESSAVRQKRGGGGIASKPGRLGGHGRKSHQNSHLCSKMPSKPFSKYFSCQAYRRRFLEDTSASGVGSGRSGQCALLREGGRCTDAQVTRVGVATAKWIKICC